MENSQKCNLYCFTLTVNLNTMARYLLIHLRGYYSTLSAHLSVQNSVYGNAQECRYCTWYRQLLQQMHCLCGRYCVIQSLLHNMILQVQYIIAHVWALCTVYHCTRQCTVWVQYVVRYMLLYSVQIVEYCITYQCSVYTL